MFCVICSKELTGKQTSVCSMSCSAKRTGNIRRESGKLRKDNMTPEAYAKRLLANKKNREKHRSSRLTPRVCAVCGEIRLINKWHVKTRLTCSAVCYSYLQLPNGWSKSTDIVTYAPIAKVAKNPSGPLVTKTKGGSFRAGYCRICERSFVSQNLDNFCSQKCRRKYYRMGRHSWIAPTKRLAIYKRDNWTCLICYEPVSRADYSHEVYNPQYPSLDHIVPRSLGGTHEDSNLRTTHVLCNALRGADVSELDGLPIA